MRAVPAALLATMMVFPAAAALEYGYRPFVQGDEWDYAFTAHPPGEPPSSGFMKLRVEGIETVDGVEVVHLVRYEGCAPGDGPCEWARAREFWWRVNDHAAVRVRSWESRGDKLVEAGETSWSPPCDEQELPIAPREDWTTDCRATNRGGGMQQGESPFVMRRVARDVEAVETALRRIEAIPVAIGDEAGATVYETQWYSPEVCGWVKTETAPPIRAGYSILAYKCGDRAEGTLRPLARGLDEAREEAPGPALAGLLLAVAAVALALRGKRS